MARAVDPPLVAPGALGFLSAETLALQGLAEPQAIAALIGQVTTASAGRRLLAAMSESTFHRHFRAVTHMTPIQYQKVDRG